MDRWFLLSLELFKTTFCSFRLNCQLVWDYGRISPGQDKNNWSLYSTQIFITSGVAQFICYGRYPQTCAMPFLGRHFKNSTNQRCLSLILAKIIFFWHFALNWKFIHFFANNSGPSAYFSNMIFHLNRQRNPIVLNIHFSFSSGPVSVFQCICP